MEDYFFRRYSIYLNTIVNIKDAAVIFYLPLIGIKTIFKFKGFYEGSCIKVLCGKPRGVPAYGFTISFKSSLIRFPQSA
jgi:hypothetical protein